MDIKAISGRPVSFVKRDFKANGISVFWFSRRNLARVDNSQYERLKGRAGVTRLIFPSEVARIDLSQVSDDMLEKCIGDRAVMPGRVLDLRKLPAYIRRPGKSIFEKTISGLLKYLYFKPLQLFYYAKVRLTKAKINIAQYSNYFGEKIVAIVDYPEGDLQGRKIPWVIIPPAFGKRKETYFLLALYLKKNGFGVVRYDDSCSLGESDGEIRNQTLSKSTQNILATIDFVSRRLNARTVGLVPFSLSARPALRAAAIDRRVKFLLPIVGSPSIQGLLSKVYGEDLIADYAAGMRKGELNLLGYFIDSSSFLGDAHRKGFADLESTKRDMQRINIPVVWFCGTNDPWVDPEEVREVLRVNPAGVHHELKIFPDLTHRFREAEKAQEIFAQAVRDIARLAEDREIKEVVRPWTGEVFERAMRERGRIQTIITEEEKVRLWTNYLEGFGILKETDDYMGYLEDVIKQLDFQPGERLLDAGCGNGYVIEYLLGKIINAILKGDLQVTQPGEVVGIDIVPAALTRAEESISKIKLKRRDLPATSFVEQDIDKERLGFEDWHFDKVVASLLLSYLQNPQAAVREMCRVLKPGGTIVLTSLKPDADVSQILFHFIEKLKAKYPKGEQADLWKKGRDLFNQAVSWIEGKEEEGIFKYFSAAELTALLRENGVVDIKVIRSFGGQALIVVGTKAS